MSPSPPTPPPQPGPGVLGTVVVVQGPEELRRTRAVAEIVAGVRAVAPDAEVEHVDGGALRAGEIAGLVGPSLFAPSRVVVVEAADLLGSEAADELVALARDPEPDCALVLVHPGGSRGRGTVDGLRRAGARVIPCDRPKPRELPEFAGAEAARGGLRFARGVAQSLCAAVGSELAVIAAAVAQLVDDLPEGATVISAEHMSTYYGGVADVSGFDIADALYSGRTAEALRRLRWASQANVAPVLLASALAKGARSILRYHGLPARAPESEVARALDVPPWKIRDVREQARGWDEAAAGAALSCAAALDLAVKGGTTDPEFALELAVMRIGALRDPA